ncbi:MAG: co-chaperone GroES [Trueperaceae bacterium]
MTLKPLGDKIVVEVIDEPQTTASGIVLPDSAKEKSQRGKVIAIGSGKLLDNGERVALEVSEGDTVLFAKYGGTEINLEGRELMILSERDVHAIVA